ncbi:MAG: putative bifunctional diguanylate cyclase/phosphodiesterase [Pyrinomonadaceae bacterium]
MKSQISSRGYMVSVVLSGTICVLFALINVPVATLDLQFLVLVALTIGFGSQISLQIPRFKSHISVSDTFIFLTFLLYGGECAIVLAAAEALVSSWRFCTKKITILFNAAAMAISTSVLYAVIKASGFESVGNQNGHPIQLQHFIALLCVMALVQFIVNTLTACIHDSLSNSIPLWETWKSSYAWAFISYFVGALGAGILAQLYDFVGFSIILAAVPVIFFLFLAYRMYLRNVEMSIEQAERAREYADVLEERTNALRESEHRFRSAFNYAPIGIALVSPVGHWLKVNHALSDILGYDTDEFLATDFQSMIHPGDLPITLTRVNSLLKGQISNSQMEQRYVHKDGRTVWTSWSVSAGGDLSSENANLIFQIQDITSRKFAEQKLQHEATHDALTGLPNRAYFMTRLTESLQKSLREPEHRASVLFIDLDRFKYVNDSLGHLIGDRLLIAISKRLRDCMRPADTVARLGGDEFIILVEGSYVHDEVTRVAERIQEQFATPFEISGHSIYSSASIGILHASENHLSSEDMMRDADTAMYSAKRAGKARHEIFDENMRTAASETLRLETDLRRAVENNEFSVLYQPIFTLANGELFGLEALARWQHPELGQVPPSKFVPLAEEIGWIDQLGEQIMFTACSQVNEIFEGYKNGSNVKLSINLSSRQFANQNLVERVQAILDKTGFPANRLRLEITESVFFEYQDRALEMLNRLCDLGIETDIDDFGTGYSNLGYLVRLPISTLKIDRSFVGMMLENPANREVIRTVISLARNLGLKVVAEGIETVEQRDALTYLGCDLGQGYLFAKPMPAHMLSMWLLENRSTHIPAGVVDASPIDTIQ